MPRMGPGSKHTPEAIEKMSKRRKRVAATKRRLAQEAAERARAAAIVKPADLGTLERSGTVAPALEPFVAQASAEVADLIAGLGGADELSPQRRALVEDVGRLSIAIRGEMARYLQHNDPEAAARVATLSNARRASLKALGLERYQREIEDADDYAKAIRTVETTPKENR